MVHRSAFIWLLALLPFFSIARDSIWKKIRINEDVVASLPGEIDSVLKLKHGPYTYNIYSGNIFSNIYMIQFTPDKSGLNVYDTTSYNRMLEEVQNGVVMALREKLIVLVGSWEDYFRLRLLCW